MNNAASRRSSLRRAPTSSANIRREPEKKNSQNTRPASTRRLPRHWAVIVIVYGATDVAASVHGLPPVSLAVSRTVKTDTTKTKPAAMLSARRVLIITIQSDDIPIDPTCRFFVRFVGNSAVQNAALTKITITIRLRGPNVE